MRKQILTVAMVAALLLAGSVDVFGVQRNTVDFIKDLSEKCGLSSLTELPVPEDVDPLGADGFIVDDLSPGQTEVSLEWMQYGTKYIYNQLERRHKKFWDELDAMGISYLIGNKSAKNYHTWYGTEFVSYEGMSAAEAQKTLLFFLYSNPQYYFFMPGYSVREFSAEKGAIAIWFDERVSAGNARLAATKKIKREIAESVERINQEETELAKEKVAHDLICERVVYDYDLSDENAMRNQTIYSVFLTDKTVCAGYSQAMELLCNAVGIDCIAVTSKTHEWNMLRINDIWYCTDLTWDDGDDGEVYYRFFNRSADMFLELEGGEEKHHMAQDIWNGYLPMATRDSGADDRDIGTVHIPEKQTPAPEISFSDYGTVIMEQKEDAEIYYTTDGSAPSVARSKSERYMGEMELGENTMIQAMASKDGYWDSEVVVFEWPAKTVLTYVGHPFVFYPRLEGAMSYQAEGLDKLDAGENPAVFDEVSGKFRWSPVEAQIGKSYEILFSARDSGGQILAEKVILHICDFVEGEEAIIGPKELTLEQGYTATGTGSFSVIGDKKGRKVTLVGNTGAGKVKWNETDRQIEIASGLTKGIYDMVLEAEGGEDSEIRTQFRLRIVDSKKANHLPVFQNPENNMRAYPGVPVVFYVKVRDEDLGDRVTLGTSDLSSLGGAAQFDAGSGKFSWTPEESMLGETRSVTFYASDHVGGVVRHKVDIQVVSPVSERKYDVKEDAWLNASYAGKSMANGRGIFLRANRDAAGELGEGRAAVDSGNRLMMLKFELEAFPDVEGANLYLTYICKNSNVTGKNDGQLKVAAVEGFSWSEETVTWREWDLWRQKNNFTVSEEMVAESERYKMGEVVETPGTITTETEFQGVNVVADITRIVQRALKHGQKELTLLVNTKEKGEEFFVSSEGADSKGGFTCADVTMMPSIGLKLPFAIIGTQGMTLAEGYCATETDSFSILGTERETEVKVNINVASGKDSGGEYQDYVEWDETTRQLKIREGLPKGNYRVLLIAKEAGSESSNQATAYFELNILEDRRWELEELCNEAQNMKRVDYTSMSWAKYQSVLSIAETLLHSPADVYDVERAISLLRNAQNELETLQDAWERMSAPYLQKEFEKGKYTPMSWRTYQNLVAGLKELPEGVEEEEMYLRLAELENAYQVLVRIADKSMLKILLNEIDDLDLSSYTPESVAYLKSMRDEAWVVYKNENALQSEVDAAYNHLRHARSALLAVQKKDSALKKNQRYTDVKTGISYQVASVSKKTVKVLTSKSKNVTSVVIPTVVKINGTRCRVTEIGENAFRGYRKLKKVTIGANVEKIGKRSFYKCKNLAKVTVKGTKIKAVKSNAFGNTAKKVRLALPKKISAKQKKALKKKFSNAGMKIA